MGRNKLHRPCATCQLALPRAAFAHTQWKVDCRVCRDCTSKQNRDRAMKQLEHDDTWVKEDDDDDDNDDDGNNNKPIKDNKRLERNKKRRAHMTVLFTELAEVVGLNAASDRADVLDGALQMIKRMKATSTPPTPQPHDVISSPDLTAIFDDKPELNAMFAKDLSIEQQQQQQPWLEPPIVSLSTLDIPDDLFDFMTHAPRA